MENYIDRTKYIESYLYTLTKMMLHKIKKGNCLSLGPGGGYSEILLMLDNWDVTCIDKLKYSKDIMLSHLNELKIKKNKLTFIIDDFDTAILDKSSNKFNYILAENSLPFSNKNKLYELFEKIIRNCKKKCIFSVNFFTNNHTFVKNKKCYGMNKKEINKLFKTFNITIEYINLKLNKNRKDNIVFEYYNVIGVYNS